MEIQAVIFDLDGVLVHTDRFHYLAWKQLSDEAGIYFDEKINERLRGVSRNESLEIILENYKGKPLSAEEKTAMADKKNETYRQYLGKMTPSDVSDDVRNTLKVLKDRGYHLAVGSSSKNTKFILERTDLTDGFEAVADGTMIKKTKPDPEVFLLAAKLLDVKPQNCLVVEDADAGIEAAKAGGMTAAAYGAAVHNKKADHVLNSITDLLDICL